MSLDYDQLLQVSGLATDNADMVSKTSAEEAARVKMRTLRALFNESSDDNNDGTPLLNSSFDKIMAVVNIVYALRLGAQSQLSSSDHEYLKSVYLAFDIVFLVIFSAEVVCRFKMLGPSYWYRDPWNSIDLALTFILGIDLLYKMGHVHFGMHSSLMMIRVARLIRMVRIFKRVPELVMVVDGLIHALQSLGWVICFLFVVIYVFAVFLTLELGAEDDEFARTYFGDLQHSMLTLMDIALLAEWPEIIRPIMHNQPYLIPLLLAFMTISTFGVMNILIGVIVDSTTLTRMQMERKEKLEHLKQAANLWEVRIFEKHLSEAHIQELGNDPTVSERRRLAILEIIKEIMDKQVIDFPKGLSPDDVVDLLDFDASDDLSVAEFISGLQRLLLGNEFQLTCLMLTVMGKMRTENKASVRGVEESLADVARRLEGIERHITAQASTLRGA